MTSPRIKTVGFVPLVLFALLTAACHKTAAAAPPPPPPPAAPPATAATAPAPTITLRAQPATIDRGSSTTLQWEARNAASVTITPGVGDVPTTGNRSVSPQSSVTYTATATGPGGQAGDTARVTVNIPAAAPVQPAPPRATPNATTEELFTQNMKTILFDYDKAEIRSDQMPIAQANAAWLKDHPNVRFTIEGHCDERGSEEYNLGLGDRRANVVKEYLLSQGLPASRISTVSYGEERPICRESTEDCYSRNRRAAFTLNP
jgi:peptidoglycan-associated lipoprotein